MARRTQVRIEPQATGVRNAHASVPQCTQRWRLAGTGSSLSLVIPGLINHVTQGPAGIDDGLPDPPHQRLRCVWTWMRKMGAGMSIDLFKQERETLRIKTLTLSDLLAVFRSSA